VRATNWSREQSKDSKKEQRKKQNKNVRIGEGNPEESK
jgi:hypothetical protein